MLDNWSPSVPRRRKEGGYVPKWKTAQDGWRRLYETDKPKQTIAALEDKVSGL